MTQKRPQAAHDESGDGAEAQKAKKPYLTPQLQEYGSIAKLTQTGAGTGTDGGAVAGMMMSCL